MAYKKKGIVKFCFAMLSRKRIILDLKQIFSAPTVVQVDDPKPSFRLRSFFNLAKYVSSNWRMIFLKMGVSEANIRARRAKIDQKGGSGATHTKKETAEAVMHFGLVCLFQLVGGCVQINPKQTLFPKEGPRAP